MTMPVRIRQKIQADLTGCWLWTGALDRHGYGVVRDPAGRTRKAHRVVYEGLVGPIPKGLTLDHLCRVPGCVNPDHLEPVTQAENVRRGQAGRITGARMAAKTHCPKGHPYDQENTYVWRGHRSCRACRRAR